MARSGRCRCGTLLLFEMTARGYKTRCPKCQAIVRLRDPAEASEPTAARAEALAATVDHAAPDGPPDFNVLSRHEPDAPVALAEIEAYNGPEARAPAPSSPPWWLLAVAVLAVLVTVGTVTALLTL
jgi:phage FluMu protein Com